MQSYWPLPDHVETTKLRDTVVKVADEGKLDVGGDTALAVYALQLFIEANYVGNGVYKDAIPVESVSACDHVAIEWLRSDGEEINENLVAPVLLAVAEISLQNADQDLHARWWLARTRSLHAMLLKGQSFDLEQLVVDSYESLIDETATPLDRTLLTLELARAQLIFKDTYTAKDLLDEACAQRRLEYHMTGVKAKKTKFQKLKQPALVVLASSQTPVKNIEPVSFKPVPLNSETLLEVPEYDQSEEFPSFDTNKPTLLTPIDAVILSLYARYYTQKSPSLESDAMSREEVLAHLDRIISTSSEWLTTATALWQRSAIERYSSQTIERGVLQMEALEKDFAAAPVSSLEFFHQLFVPTCRTRDTELVDRLLSLGLFKTAIPICRRLNRVVDLALCLAVSGSESEAREVLNKYLAKNPKDGRAWSVLGDITRDPAHYLKAWETARYGKAKLALGQLSLKDNKYQEAIVHLKDASSVIGQIREPWYLYGFALMQLHNYDEARYAFTRCISIDDEDMESWSNLATCLTQLGQKAEALNALKRAVAVSRDDASSGSTSKTHAWKVWQNYSIIAADQGKWAESLQGLKMLVSHDKKDAIQLGVVQDLAAVLMQGKPNELTSLENQILDFLYENLQNRDDMSHLFKAVDAWKEAV
ncbi:hypothetical protein CANCADRAFT_32303 [Tortispora caseinolytica NRRL Y-17796]|uniref:Uncharacterized protein n=1 Tax=Tortispora caseinolytica NRRL Y-17796 TaxID=767744 RepID=A0A1E4TAU5_9ASCO|nr:hypothetical protein CANCADRAFT_32303 [Tortispora caseinolytica NRRL Y-17796]